MSTGLWVLFLPTFSMGLSSTTRGRSSWWDQSGPTQPGMSSRYGQYDPFIIGPSAGETRRRDDLEDIGGVYRKPMRRDFMRDDDWDYLNDSPMSPFMYDEPFDWEGGPPLSPMDRGPMYRSRGLSLSSDPILGPYSSDREFDPPMRPRGPLLPSLDSDTVPGAYNSGMVRDSRSRSSRSMESLGFGMDMGRDHNYKKYSSFDGLASGSMDGFSTYGSREGGIYSEGIGGVGEPPRRRMSSPVRMSSESRERPGPYSSSRSPPPPARVRETEDFAAGVPPQIYDKTIDALLEATNAERRRQQGNRLRDLRYSRELSKAAQQHADSMARHNYFSHEGKDGSDLKDRVRRFSPNYRFTTVGENLGWRHPTNNPEKAVANWMKSKEGHRENLLGSDYTDIGLGYAVSPDGEEHYYVQVFGKPSRNPSVSSKDETLDLMYQLTNRARQASSRGGKRLAPLSVSPKLHKAAQEYANVAAQTGRFFGHFEPYEYAASNGFRLLAVNSAVHRPFNDPKDAVDSWLQKESSSHNYILNHEFTEMGLGYACFDGEQHYYVQLLGTPDYTDVDYTDIGPEDRPQEKPMRLPIRESMRESIRLREPPRSSNSIRDVETYRYTDNTRPNDTNFIDRRYSEDYLKNTLNSSTRRGSRRDPPNFNFFDGYSDYGDENYDRNIIADGRWREDRWWAGP